MNGKRPQSALREIRGHLTNPATLIALAAVAAVLTLVGPFGTDQSLSPGFRALYWLTMVGTTYVTGYAIDTILRSRLPGRLAFVVNPLVMGLAITCVVVVVNLALLARPPTDERWVLDILTIYAIAVIVSAAMQIVVSSLARGDASGASSDMPAPPLLDRLPLEKRGTLVALSVEDHYVRVRTTKGEEMILMRLSDAIRETAPEAGLRVHRSHWVARNQVTAARRDGDRAILSMAHGGDIPVSRSHIPAVKEAGLLPK